MFVVSTHSHLIVGIHTQIVSPYFSFTFRCAGWIPFNKLSLLPTPEVIFEEQFDDDRACGGGTINRRQGSSWGRVKERGSLRETPGAGLEHPDYNGSTFNGTKSPRRKGIANSSLFLSKLLAIRSGGPTSAGN